MTGHLSKRNEDLSVRVFDKVSMLWARAHSGAHRKPLQRLACGVAIALVGSLCLATPTSKAQDLQQKTPFAYSSSMIGDIQTECLFRDRKSTRLNSSHSQQSRMPSSA